MIKRYLLNLIPRVRHSLNVLNNLVHREISLELAYLLPVKPSHLITTFLKVDVIPVRDWQKIS